jgi:WD40 repeat protein
MIKSGYGRYEAEVIADIPYESRINEIDFSPDGSLLAVASLYEETTIWDVQTRALLYTLDQTIEDMTDGTIALAFSPDGGHLALIRNNGLLSSGDLPGADPLEEPEINIKEPPPIPGDVLFDTGSSELKASADEILSVSLPSELHMQPFQKPRLHLSGIQTAGEMLHQILHSL